MGRPRSARQLLPRLGRIVGRFWPYIRKQRILLSGSIVALFLEVVLRVLEPWPLKFVFDRVLAEKVGTDTSTLSFAGVDPFYLLGGAALAQVVVTGLRALVTYYGTVGFALAGQRVLSEIRALLYRHLQVLSLSFHSKARSGDLVVRVIGDIGTLREVIVTAFLPLIAKTMIFLAMLGLMFWFSWYLTLIALLPFPLFWLKTVRTSSRIHQVAREQRQRQGAMAATAAESFGAIKTVQALSLEGSFSQTFSSQNNKSLKEGARAKRLAASLERTSDLVLAVSTALILLFGARLVLNNQLTPGDLLVFLYYVKQAFRPARDFARYTARLAKATAAGERVLDVLEQSPEVQDLPGAVEAPSLEGRIAFDQVQFSYEPGKPVLRGVHLEIGPGETLALTGPSGGGKSTLVSLLLRLFDPGEGRITLDGRDLREWTLESVRSQMSTVLQDNLLFSGTIRENVTFGRDVVGESEVLQAIRLANADEFIDQLPEGLDTPVGERGVTLSHGQRQRIAIARAAARRTRILILDEPTAGLDDENARWVAQSIQRLSGTCTTLLVTHDLRLASCADRVAYLAEGKILEYGTPEELKNSGGAFSSLFEDLQQTWLQPLEGVAQA